MIHFYVGVGWVVVLVGLACLGLGVWIGQRLERRRGRPLQRPR